MSNINKYIKVKVHVKSSKPRVEVEKAVSMFGNDSEDGDVYHVYVSSPPDKGKANIELIELLSEYLDLAKSRINIIKGYTSRTKLVEIQNEQA